MLIMPDHEEDDDDKTEGCRWEAILEATRSRVLLDTGPVINEAMHNWYLLASCYFLVVMGGCGVV
jgi:hypothetical protein